MITVAVNVTVRTVTMEEVMAISYKLLIANYEY